MDLGHAAFESAYARKGMFVSAASVLSGRAQTQCTSPSLLWMSTGGCTSASNAWRGECSDFNGSWVRSGRICRGCWTRAQWQRKKFTP